MNQTHQPDNQGDSRPVIIHNHIFKNAGSTFDWALARNFKGEFVDHRDNESMRHGAHYLSTFLTDHPNVQALSTHHLTLPLPNLSSIHLLLATILREPIERVTSVYTFERKQKSSSTPGSIKAKNLTMQEYVMWRMKKDVGPTIRDFQTRRCLPPIPVNADINQDMLNAAKHLLDNMPLLGLVELFDESMVLFEEKLKNYFPNINLAYVQQNVSQSKNNSRENRITKLQNELGNKVFETLITNNKNDIELHDYSIQLVKQRMEKTPDFDVKLLNFRERCSKLSGSFLNKIKAFRF